MNQLMHVSAGGVRIAARIEAGPPGAPTVVLSHSLGCDLSMWDPQIEGLTRHFRVVRFDHRGHGKSDAPAGDYSIDRLGRDALAVIEATSDGQPVHFCGLSMGAMVGMWLTLHHPQRLKRLALANTAAHIPMRAMFEQRIATARSEGMGSIAAPTMDRWLSEAFRTAQPARRDALVDAMLRMSPEGYAGCCAVLRDTDLRADIGGIRLPTLVIGGGADAATPPAAMEGLAAAIPGARAVILEGAGHLSNIEQARAFTEALLNHFQPKDPQ